MARHRKDFTGERYTARITALLTPADRLALDQASEQMGMNPSAFARLWIMKGIATRAVRGQLTAQRDVDRRQLDALTRHGQALNDLAHRANESQEITEAPALAAVLDVLTQEMERIAVMPYGGGRVPPERLALMNEVTRIGTNAMQLMKIASLRNDPKTVAMLDRFHDGIALCVERMIAT